MRVFVNPSGKFVLGGPHADAGLTGRKIIVDTYGGMARHGGGAFSGKDPSKVDRSAAYAARWVAKHVVAAGAAERCEVQVAYAIGVARPVSVLVETFGTERVDRARIAKAVDAIFDLRPAAIIRDLDLRRPIYRNTAAYGHFGRSRSRLHVGADAARRRSAPRIVPVVVTRCVRVVTENAAVDRAFDYEVTDAPRSMVHVGDRVRVGLQPPLAARVGDGRRRAHARDEAGEEVAGPRSAARDDCRCSSGRRERWCAPLSRFLLAASPRVDRARDAAAPPVAAPPSTPASPPRRSRCRPGVVLVSPTHDPLALILHAYQSTRRDAGITAGARAHRGVGPAPARATRAARVRRRPGRRTSGTGCARAGRSSWARAARPWRRRRGCARAVVVDADDEAYRSAELADLGRDDAC